MLSMVLTYWDRWWEWCQRYLFQSIRKNYPLPFCIKHFIFMCLCFQTYTSHFRFLHHCILFTLNFSRIDVGVTLSIFSLFQFLFISLLTFRAILTLDSSWNSVWYFCFLFSGQIYIWLLLLVQRDMNEVMWFFILVKWFPFCYLCFFDRCPKHYSWENYFIDELPFQF